MPREGALKLDDLVRGEVEFQWAQEADHVIQRADGSFIYHLANVVDDRDYGITHVIRAEEHLSNTPRQVFMVQALGYPMPAYAHLPYVAEPGSKRKLSKRKLDQYLKNPDFKKVHDHGTQIATAMKLPVAAETFNPVIVDFYEQVGYLPDAIVNYLVLLGWSLDDKTEWFTREEMVRDFSLERVQKAPASFDPAKLQAFQTHYMQQVPLDEKVRRVRPFVERAGLAVDDDKLRRIVEALGDRIKVFGDILLQGAYFFGDDVPAWDDKAFAKRVLAPGAVDKLAAYREWLGARDAASLRRGRRSSRRRSRGSASAAGRSATSCTPCASRSPASAAARGCSTAWPCSAATCASAASTPRWPKRAADRGQGRRPDRLHRVAAGSARARRARRRCARG